MPNFVGMGRSSVYAEMFRAQLYFKTAGTGANTSSWVRVVAELPAAGTLVPLLSTVTLEVTTVPLVAAPVKRVVTAAVVTRPVTKKSTVKVDAIVKTVTATPTTKKRAVHHEVATYRKGVATWYSYIPGQCASWYLPKGTVITVVDLRNGHSVKCRVTDHEEAHGDRVVDLSETQFLDLAPLGVGVVPVKVTW
jgi:rare lipoprotein A (peptidoglycan hydrolase)